jgi:hypothetical protein
MSEGAKSKLILVTALSPTPAGEGKTTTSIGLNEGLNKIGKKSIVVLREPSARPRVRHEGWRGRWRLCPGGAHGGHQPPLHRRFQRDREGQQPPRRAHRQQPPEPQAHAQHRSAHHQVEARDGHERPRPARHHHRPRRHRQRHPTSGWLQHHTGQRGHGDPLPRHRASRT